MNFFRSGNPDAALNAVLNTPREPDENSYNETHGAPNQNYSILPPSNQSPSPMTSAGKKEQIKTELLEHSDRTLLSDLAAFELMDNAGSSGQKEIARDIVTDGLTAKAHQAKIDRQNTSLSWFDTYLAGILRKIEDMLDDKLARREAIEHDLLEKEESAWKLYAKTIDDSEHYDHLKKTYWASFALSVISWPALVVSTCVNILKLSLGVSFLLCLPFLYFAYSYSKGIRMQIFQDNKDSEENDFWEKAKGKLMMWLDIILEVAGIPSILAFAVGIHASTDWRVLFGIGLAVVFIEIQNRRLHSAQAKRYLRPYNLKVAELVQVKAEYARFKARLDKLHEDGMEKGEKVSAKTVRLLEDLITDLSTKSKKWSD